jgi:hypothetical protein
MVNSVIPMHQDLHRRLAILVLEKDLDALLVGVVGQLGYRLHKSAPHLRVGTLEGVVVPLGPRPDYEVRPYLRAQIYAASQSVYPLSPELVIRVDEGA